MVSNYEIKLTLDALQMRIQLLEAKINSLPEIFSKAMVQHIKTLSFKVSDSKPLGYLNVAEQKTLEVLGAMENPLTASEVAAITGRARAVESMYLNELHRRDVILKERKGRRVIFTLKDEYCAEDLCKKPRRG